MPIYEYACDGCGHEFETLQKMSEEPLRECPSCHQMTLRRLVSAAGFQLKGTGWYVTDFRGKGGKKDTGEKADKAEKPEKSEAKESKEAKGTPPAGSTSANGS